MFQEYFKVSWCFKFNILSREFSLHTVFTATRALGGLSIVYLFVLDVNVDVFVTLNVGGGVVAMGLW